MKLRNVVIVVAVAIALVITVALLVDATMVGRAAYRPGQGTIGGHPLPIGTHSVGSIILIVLLGHGPGARNGARPFGFTCSLSIRHKPSLRDIINRDRLRFRIVIRQRRWNRYTTAVDGSGQA
jgi:hypothetical protein